MSKDGTKFFEIFFRRVPANILVALRRNTKEVYITILTKKAGCTYDRALIILNKMEKANLVELVKQRRIKIVRLTDKGNNVAQHVEKIQQHL